MAEKSATEICEAAIQRLAGRHLHLLTTAQLRAAGVSADAIGTRVRRGRLHRIHQGVFAVHPPPFDREQIWLAAVLACGPGAALSHEPSAILQGFLAQGTLIPHVTVPGGRGRSRKGIVVHTGSVDPRDLRSVRGVPCTSADHTLVDLASSRDDGELEMLLVAAQSLGFVKRSRLHELVSERRGRPGASRLARLLEAEPAIARSWAEVHFLPVCRLADVPRPLLNHPVAVPTQARPLTVDFAWPKIRMAIELDSQRFHGDWESAVHDRERDQALALAGWECHRFVRSRVERDPQAAARRLGALHAMRLGLMDGGSGPAPGAAGA